MHPHIVFAVCDLHELLRLSTRRCAAVRNERVFDAVLYFQCLASIESRTRGGKKRDTIIEQLTRPSVRQSMLPRGRQVATTPSSSLGASTCVR